jgi:hypothetical protein
MLFTDNDVCSAADLLLVDSEVNAVASMTKPAITVDGSGSICEMNWAECQHKILAAMQSYVSYPAQTGMPATHIAAVTNVGVPARTQPRVRLNQIVTSDPNYGVSQSAIKTWMVYSALAMFFRDASSRLGKDRFEEKYNRYSAEAQTKWRQLRNSGLPMIYNPLEAPGAKHAFAAGSWSTANVSSVSGGSGAGGTFQVAVTYYDASKYTSEAVNGNAESGPSTIVSQVVTASHAVKVDITSLNPPTGVMDPVGLSQGLMTPLNATHWNIFCGASSGPLYYQASVPIATKTYTLAGDPVLSGSVLGQGQYPSLNLVMSRIVMRG